MATYSVSDTLFRVLCDRNRFPVPQADLIFFGIRGSVPLNPGNHTFGQSHKLVQMGPNYLHPRCTVAQWRPASRQVAVFPASTVPHLSNVKVAQGKQGKGTNQLFTGFYSDYRKGVHKAGSETGHHAFRQTESRFIHRTSDDFDYDNLDHVEYGNPYDNMHAAWCGSLDQANFASAGCQVILGYPKCKKRGNLPDSGPWAVFRANAYNSNSTQNSFPYVLLTGNECLRVSVTGADGSFRLRYGSRGAEVEILQDRLGQLYFYEGAIDGKFGERTMRALLAFQRQAFGPDGADGIVGPLTWQALQNSEA